MPDTNDTEPSLSVTTKGYFGEAGTFAYLKGGIIYLDPSNNTSLGSYMVELVLTDTNYG